MKLEELRRHLRTRSRRLVKFDQRHDRESIAPISADSPTPITAKASLLSPKFETGQRLEDNFPELYRRPAKLSCESLRVTSSEMSKAREREMFRICDDKYRSLKTDTYLIDPILSDGEPVQGQCSNCGKDVTIRVGT